MDRDRLFALWDEQPEDVKAHIGTLSFREFVLRKVHAGNDALMRHNAIGPGAVQESLQEYGAAATAREEALAVTLAHLEDVARAAARPTAPPATTSAGDSASSGPDAGEAGAPAGTES